MNPSEHACKIFFNYSKLCVISFFAKKVQFLLPKHAFRCFSNEFLQHYWQESFDGDSFVSQSRFETYAYTTTRKMQTLITIDNLGLFYFVREANLGLYVQSEIADFGRAMIVFTGGWVGGWGLTASGLGMAI